jgi:hypothetical protein
MGRRGNSALLAGDGSAPSRRQRGGSGGAQRPAECAAGHRADRVLGRAAGRTAHRASTASGGLAIHTGAGEPATGQPPAGSGPAARP